MCKIIEAISGGVGVLYLTARRCIVVISINTYTKAFDLSKFSRASAVPQPPIPFPACKLTVVRLACQRGFNTLFSELNFAVEAGMALQITGANGIGKTSLLRILCGLSLAEQGSVWFNDAPIKNNISAYHASLSYLGHNSGLKPELTPMENLATQSALYLYKQARNQRQQTKNTLAIFNIGDRQNQPCRLLSAGQKQRIALARVVCSNAPIWILDEPATALDADGVTTLSAQMALHLHRGGLIIFSSHQHFRLAHKRLQRIALDAQ